MVMEWNSRLAKSRWCQGSADIIYRMWRISQVCGPGIVNDVATWVTHRIFITNRLHYGARLVL